MDAVFGWRGDFASAEANSLHAEAFGTRVYDVSERDWRSLVEKHSLGWVTARAASGQLTGFVNVIWDGRTHAWIQDVMVAAIARHQGIGRRLVQHAADEARAAGSEWLHVDFDDGLRAFYFDACGFTPATVGLLRP